MRQDHRPQTTDHGSRKTLAMALATLHLALGTVCAQTNIGLTATVTPGYQFSSGERYTPQKFNLLGIPTVQISGTVSGGLLSTNSIGKQHLSTNVFDQVYISGGDNVSATIIDGSLTGTKMATNSIGGTNITDGTITVDDLATNTLQGVNLATNAFTNLSVVTPATNDLVLLMDASATSNTVAATVATLFTAGLAVVAPPPLYTTNGLALGSGGSILNAAHGLGRAPYSIQCWLVCTSTDNGYAAGEAVAVESTSSVNLDYPGAVTVGYTGTTDLFAIAASSSIIIMNKSTGTGDPIDRSKWTVTIHAW